MSEYQIIKRDGAPRVPFKFDGRILYTSDRFEMVHLTLPPGTGMELHSQPFDVVFYLIEGTGILTVNQLESEVQPETSVWVKAGAQRAWKNNGTGVLNLLVCKLKS